jgi:spermidine synthase
VILGGISLGNYVGGRLADRYPPRELASVLLLCASVLVFLILAFDPLLSRILGSSEGGSLTTGVVARAVLSIAFLFLLPSAALGTVSPAIAKLVLEGSPRIGNAVGTVYALGSIGSIVGTFLSGFVLIPLLGVRSIVLVVGGVVAILALLMGRRRLPAIIWIVLMVVLYVLLSRAAERPGTLFSGYSAYSHIEVRDKSAGEATERILVMDGLIHNRYDPAHPDSLLYEYERVFAAVTALHAPPARGGLRTLTLGGGAFLFPVYLERHFPGTHEVVEIDPDVIRTARRFFDLPLDSAIRTDVADARTFVRWARGQRQYDIAYLDAFNSFSVPGHLTTLEFTRDLASLLAPDGIFVCNLIDIFSVGRFLGAYLQTMRVVFPEVAVYEVPGSARDVRSTFVVVCAPAPGLPVELPAYAGPGSVARRISDVELALLQGRTRSVPLTDDHSPVENLIAPVFLRSVR